MGEGAGQGQVRPSADSTRHPQIIPFPCLGRCSSPITLAGTPALRFT